MAVTSIDLGDSGTQGYIYPTCAADGAPATPLTVVIGVNDEFVYTGGGGAGSPETFTVAPGVYTTLAGCVAAMGAATGSVSGEAFSTIVTPSIDPFAPTLILLTMLDPGAPNNGNTITLGGNDVAAALGFTANPDVFSGSGPLVISIPITVDVARSDPVDGATLVVVWLSQNVVFSVTDDAPTDSFYNLHLFSDGLNHYTNSTRPIGGNGANVGACVGLILNPLVNGVNNLIITLPNDTSDFVAVARAYFGVNADTSGSNWPGLDADLGWMASGTPANLVTGLAKAGVAESAILAYDVGADNFTSPGGATDATWFWGTGNLAVYTLGYAIATGPGCGPTGAWLWDDGSIVTVNEIDDYPFDQFGELELGSFAIAEQSLSPPTAPGGIALTGAWTAGGACHSSTGLQAGILRSGPGPTWPPGLATDPVAHHSIPLLVS